METIVKTQEAMGKTIDDAVAAAKAALHLAPDAQVEVEVLEEPKKALLGFIGGSLAKVRITYTEEPQAPEPEPAEAPEKEEPREEYDDEPEAPKEPVVRTYETLDRPGVKMAKAFIDGVVQNMQMDVTIDLYDGDNNDTVIDIVGDKAGVLIGHHGETLDALQYLANLSANKHIGSDKKEYCRITVDVEGYRAKREATLRDLARRKAAQVLKYKKSVMLEPMNPYERRIIHSQIQEIPGVSTNSIGADDSRRVVIYLDDQRQTPDEE